jgi:putative glutamine amidotransferase
VSIDHVRPLVIVPARFSADASALRYEAEVAAAKLLEAVWDAGGEPLVVHPTALREPEVDTLRRRFWMADAVLLPGGGDLSPRWYGQQPHPTLYNVDEAQDAFDLAMARWAIADQIPLLAICRGNQVVNVALGGTLVQDMTEQIGRTHRQFVHDIELDDDSPLREVVTDDRITISCSHHQCIANLGESLVAAAHAADGTIEAVTLSEHDAWYLGVQWHLEDFADTDPIQHGIFRAFVAAAT